MEKYLFKIYKKIKNRINNPKALMDIVFLKTKGNKIKSENFVRLLYERDKGIELVEFTKNIYGYSTYLSFNDDLKKINNDGTKELNSLKFYAKEENKLSRCTDFSLSNLKIRRGYSLSKFNSNDKIRFEQFVLVLDVILKNEDDTSIFFDTIIKFDENNAIDITVRNNGTMLVMYDSEEFLYSVAPELDLKPMVQTLYDVKAKTNPLLDDLSSFKNSNFDYYINLTSFKNTKTNEIYALICLADSNKTEEFIAYKIFKLENKLKNIEDVICSSIYMFFEEFGVPTVINTISPILFEYLTSLTKNGIEVLFTYDGFHTALMRHLTNTLNSYVTHYEMNDINLNNDLFDKIILYYRYILMNGFNPIEHFLIDKDEDLYLLIDDFFKKEDINYSEDNVEDENNGFIN